MKGRGRPSAAEREKDIEMIREHWFKNHKTRSTTQEWRWPSDPNTPNKAYFLEWRNPESWNFAVRYVIWSNTLYISGDLGDAVHQWGQHVTFPWIANCDLGYYAEKCQASESGRNFVDWDPRLLVDYIREQDARDCPWQPELLQAAESNGSNHQEWSGFLHEWYQHSAPHDKIDTEYLSAISGAGYRIALRCMAHLEGIKMAVAQMNETKPA